MVQIGTTPLDAELAKITDNDREYAIELVEDLDEESDEGERLRIAAQWLRKAKYEAVIADRKRREPAPAFGGPSFGGR